jgi:hypothetical protein
MDDDDKRQLAIDLFNDVWTFLEKPDRTPDDDATMIHRAHASCALWMEVGKPENAARGEWQVSRAYATAGRSEPALFHARRCVELCERHGIGDWDIAFAYEAVARASAVAGDAAETTRWKDRATEAANAVEDPEDRDLVLADIATIPAP